VAIMTWLPSILNMLLDALTKTVSVFNEKGAPDLVADILLTLFREVKPDTVAALFNESTEIIRKFHTGSALIGEPGAPRLPGDLYANLSEITAQINAETLSKARLALAEIREAASCSLIDALEEQPALMEEAIKNKSGRYNARIRTAHHRLSAADSMDPDRFQASVKAFFSAFDTQETADTANTGAVLLNRILEAAPDTVSEKTAAFADSLDPFEASELLQALRNRTGHALMPLARACIPHLVEGLLTALAPADDEFEDAAKQARKKLFSFLHSQGGQTHD